VHHFSNVKKQLLIACLATNDISSGHRENAYLKPLAGITELIFWLL
jgi:hypothetical protein